MRSGTQTLGLLASPLNWQILSSLADGAKRQGDLRRAGGSPAQTTLRAQLNKLDALGAVAKRRHNRFPGGLGYELTAAGRELLDVAGALEQWLERSPGGPLRLGDPAAKAAIKALVEGWSSAMLRALAARPLALTELDGLIASLSYPSLERRLAAMRLAGLVEARAADGHGRPYGVSEWVRRGVAPLVAAAHWERRHRPGSTPPLGKLDAESAFLLAMPLLRLPDGVSGCCRLAVELSSGSGRRSGRDLAGVLVEARERRVASCTTRLEGDADAWASGPAQAWLAAVVDSDSDGLELGGDGRLARLLLDSLHAALFPEPKAVKGLSR